MFQMMKDHFMLAVFIQAGRVQKLFGAQIPRKNLGAVFALALRDIDEITGKFLAKFTAPALANAAFLKD